MRFKLIERAEKLNDIKSDLRSHRSKYVEHLISMYLWSSKDCVHHWVSEIYSYYGSISKMKSNNKFPSKEIIYNSIIGDILDVLPNNIPIITEYIIDVKESKLEKPENIEYDKMLNFIKEVSDYISDKLMMMELLTLKI